MIARTPLSAPSSHANTAPSPARASKWRNPVYYADNEPVLRQYSPGTTNLRSSAFICGSFFAGAPDIKDVDRINRMDRINPSTKSLSEKSINSIFTKEPQRIQRAQRFFKRVSVFSVLSVVLTSRIGSNPVNPVNPVHSGSSFSAAPDINNIKFIKLIYPNSALTSKPACQQTDEANTDDTDRTDFHGYEIRVHPCHPYNPCSTAASLFVEAQQNNKLYSIKLNHQSLRPLRSLRWCPC